MKGKLLRSVEINLIFGFGASIPIFDCLLQTKPANAFEAAAWERVKAIKPNFALKETREEHEL